MRALVFWGHVQMNFACPHYYTVQWHTSGFVIFRSFRNILTYLALGYIHSDYETFTHRPRCCSNVFRLPCSSFSTRKTENYTHIIDRVVNLSEHEAFTCCWFNVGPASQTVAQYWTNIAWTPRVFVSARTNLNDYGRHDINRSLIRSKTVRSNLSSLESGSVLICVL